MSWLTDRLANREMPPILAPGVFDGLSARMASMAGAEALYLSGASLAKPLISLMFLLLANGGLLGIVLQVRR